MAPHTPPRSAAAGEPGARLEYGIRSRTLRTPLRIASRTVLATIVAAVWLAGCASVETGPPRDVGGTWIGECQNCPVRRFTLVMTQNGEQLSGTLQASPRTGLGERPMPLVDGKVSGRTVTFKTKAADGIDFNADLRVSGDGKRMDGHGSHRAAFPLSFRRE